MATSTGMTSARFWSPHSIDLITPLPAPTSTPTGPLRESTQPGIGSRKAGVTVCTSNYFITSIYHLIYLKTGLYMFIFTGLLEERFYQTCCLYLPKNNKVLTYLPLFVIFNIISEISHPILLDFTKTKCATKSPAETLCSKNSLAKTHCATKSPAETLFTSSKVTKPGLIRSGLDHLLSLA